MAIGIALIVLLNIWIAIRYAKQAIGPDEGIWLLWGFTGAKPYRDFVDCKPPGIHLWMWLLAKLTGRRLELVKLIHHLAMGCFPVAAYLLSGELSVGLLATALLQSAWLLAYQSWMDAISGGFLLLAVLLPPTPATVCIGLAVFFNLKAAVPGALWMLLSGWWLQILGAGIVACGIAGTWMVVWPTYWHAMWFSAVTVSRRMLDYRKQFDTPWEEWGWHWSVPLLLIVPVLVVCFLTRPDPVLWLTVVAYIVFNAGGRVWRPNHWLPLTLVVVTAPPLEFAIGILAMEWIASRFYLGSVWQVTYPGIWLDLCAAKQIGERLRDEAGDLWVNTIHTQIYIYAAKKPKHGMVEQVEIKNCIPHHVERRERLLRSYPPEWIVVGPGGTPAQSVNGYRQKLAIDNFMILG